MFTADYGLVMLS